MNYETVNFGLNEDTKHFYNCCVQLFMLNYLDSIKVPDSPSLSSQFNFSRFIKIPAIII